MNRLNVGFCVPTVNSSEYISGTIKKLIAEKEVLDTNGYNVSIIICVNGPNSTQTLEVLENIKKKNHETLVILHNLDKGKNRALNSMIQYCKSNNYDIIHFFDDDIELVYKSTLLNIEALIESRHNNELNFITGSNFYAKKQKFRIVKKHLTIFPAIKEYLMQYIYMVSFSEHSDINDFLSGSSICLWADTCPYIPDDTTGIADDSFLSNYFGLMNKPSNRITNIIKPANSIVYFYVPYRFSEWKKQQKRVMIGVERSFLYFGQDYDYLQNIFMYRYSEHPRYRKNIKNVGLRNRFFLIILRYYQKIILKEAEKEFEFGKSIEWDQISTSKPKE